MAQGQMQPNQNVGETIQGQPVQNNQSMQNSSNNSESQGMVPSNKTPSEINHPSKEPEKPDTENSNPEEKEKKPRKWWLWIIIILFILGGAAAAYFLLLKDSSLFNQVPV
jgi:hypothetical protein